MGVLARWTRRTPLCNYGYQHPGNPRPASGTVYCYKRLTSANTAGSGDGLATYNEDDEHGLIVEPDRLRNYGYQHPNSRRTGGTMLLQASDEREHGLVGRVWLWACDLRWT